MEEENVHVLVLDVHKKVMEESIKNTVKLDVIYEDQNVIFINKPSGMLSQKAKETDVSVVENVTAYLVESGQVT